MPKMMYMEVEDDLEVVENNGNLGKMLEKKWRKRKVNKRSDILKKN